MKNLILCGGVGARLWPLSRTSMPKQFYPLIKGESLFQDTVIRNRGLCSEYLLATNRAQFKIATKQLTTLNLSISGGVIEPCGRNTAPAIALSCFGLDSEEVILVTPSDHLISNIEAYKKVLVRAKELALEDNLVTFGIKPTFPETGFGYIEGRGEDVVSFKEKPELSVAKEYVACGNYYWNSGMFCFKVGIFLEELKKYSPDVYESCKTVYEGCKGSLISPDKKAMETIPSISIDYAVMEKSNKVKVVPSDIGWSDLGSFDSLYDQMYNPDKESALLGCSNPILLDSKNNLIVSADTGKKIVCIDLSDLIVVDTQDALLITKRGSSQKVKDVVSILKKEKSTLLD